MMSAVSALFNPEALSLASLLTFAFSVFVLVWGLPAFIQRRAVAKVFNKMPGPPTKPIIGNSVGTKLAPHEMFKRLCGFCKDYGQNGIFRVWFGHHRVVFLTNHKAVEPLLTSNEELHKADEYKFFASWLGEGLITVNNAAKWHSHRKLLTPAFHFKILEDFLVVMNKQAKILVKKLSDKADGKPFDIFPYIKYCTLDVICESAMGVSINAQDDGKESEYIEALNRMGKIPMRRNQTPWLRNQLLWKLSGNLKSELHDVDVLKGFTRAVIKDRKEAMKNHKKGDTKETSVEGTKKRKAFLDLVLSAQTANGQQALTDDEIQQEVDTFMFAGHDTTSMALNWFMFLMGSHPEIQERLYEEIMGIMGDRDSEATPAHLREMKYLECCIKEGLRVLPSVPIYARKLLKDTVINGYVVPAGTSATVFPYALHRDPAVWKDPDTYNPDRFLTENIAGLNPFAYVPFSAGPRNCIGQKFAQWEEKCLVSHIIRNFKISTDMTFDTIQPQGALVLVPANGIIVKLTPRE